MPVLPGAADPDQGHGRHVELQLAAAEPGADAIGLQQSGDIDGHLVAEAAQAAGRHLELLTEPLQLEPTAAEAAAAHPELVLQHFKREPQLLGCAALAAQQLPLGLLWVAVDAQALAA